MEQTGNEANTKGIKSSEMKFRFLFVSSELLALAMPECTPGCKLICHLLTRVWFGFHLHQKKSWLSQITMQSTAFILKSEMFTVKISTNSFWDIYWKYLPFSSVLQIYPRVSLAWCGSTRDLEANRYFIYQLSDPLFSHLWNGNNTPVWGVNKLISQW